MVTERLCNTFLGPSPRVITSRVAEAQKLGLSERSFVRFTLEMAAAAHFTTRMYYSCVMAHLTKQIEDGALVEVMWVVPYTVTVAGGQDGNYAYQSLLRASQFCHRAMRDSF